MKSKMNLYKVLIALFCCVILAGLLITALTDRNEAPTAGWTQSGTCEWKIDDGVLTIRPLGDAREGTLADWGTGNSPWYENTTITSVVVKSGVKAATCRFMFAGCTALTSLDLSGFDTSQVTDMSGMFSSCTALTAIDLRSIETSQVTNMYAMFEGCAALKELTLGANFNFKGNSCLPDPSSIAPYTGKWANGALSLTASRFTEQYNGSAMAGTWVWETKLHTGWTQSGTCEWKIDDGVLTIRPLGDGREGTLADWGTGSSPWVNNFDIISVVVKSGVKAATCHGMFYGCRNLISLDLSSFDTSQVTDMSLMFYECQNLTTLDLSSFETSQVTDMSLMFRGCAALTTFDLSSFETSQVTDMLGMFAGCAALTTLDLNNFDTGKVTSMSVMFYGCSALASLDLSSFETSQVTNMYAMFEGCAALKELTLGANFNFKSDSRLPSPSDIAPYTGKWANGAWSLTARQFMEQYNGSAMAGTWVWERSVI